MKKPMKVLLVATAALSMVAVGLTFARGPDEKDGPGSPACKQTRKQGLRQTDNPGNCKGNCNPENCKGNCNPENCKGNCNPENCKGCKRHGRRHGCWGAGTWHGKIKGARYTVTNTENGVTIEITSDVPAVVQLIQTHFAKFPERCGHECGSAACRRAHQEGRCKNDAGPDTAK